MTKADLEHKLEQCEERNRALEAINKELRVKLTMSQALVNTINSELNAPLTARERHQHKAFKPGSLIEVGKDVEKK